MVLKREMNTLENGAVGFVAGALAGALTNAFDVVKTQVFRVLHVSVGFEVKSSQNCMHLYDSSLHFECSGYNIQT